MEDETLRKVANGLTYEMCVWVCGLLNQQLLLRLSLLGIQSRSIHGHNFNLELL